MQTVFRKEIKYIIYRSDFLRIKKHLDAVLEKDAHGGPDGYLVRSLYFDSLYDRDLNDVLDGVLEKRKIRIRIYNPEQEKAKLEYKCKSGTDGRKNGLQITREEVHKMEHMDYSFLMDRPEEIAWEIYRRLLSGAYTPKTIIEYQRLAYIYPVSDVRISFDTDIRTSGTPFGLYESAPLGIPVMMPHLGVLEVKYSGFLPTIIKELIAPLDHVAVANSKYAVSRLFV
ncbi:VTC domain-containing protein [Desulfonispora thiosulfatigenes DSM 11270]|uniref:VTC domain-containing protein n=1 Tax=Desulfonispora thiosulfatigenes DSM 11270 TaxID=656914 RepID=A0A1W1V7K0_DESTI|nr:polyphosphate polymerase domain-containing protein [Desulfonispora thiosulfatigenes]SMB89011.1 VTC domain-containing protein [Desulfonispora thiosulfatigenes DSM 11270]